MGLTDSCVAEAQQEPSCVGVEESKVGRLVWFLCYVCVLVVYQHQKHCVCVCFIVWVCVWFLITCLCHRTLSTPAMHIIYNNRPQYYVCCCQTKIAVVHHVQFYIF